MSHPYPISIEDAIPGTKSHDTSLNIHKGKKPGVLMFPKLRASPLLSDEEGITSSETDLMPTNIQVSA